METFHEPPEIKTHKMTFEFHENYGYFNRQSSFQNIANELLTM